MTAGGRADVQRWSAEVARDPDSLAFVPLAEAYRRQGKRDAALKVCLRGLSRHPTHLEAHGLLARLYLEDGERQKAADEWAVMLRLDESNFDANRGMGFYHLDRGDAETARGHLERAAAARPSDPTVNEALSLLEERQGAGGEQPAPSGAEAPGGGAGREPSGGADPVRASAGTGSSAPRDPSRVFEPLAAEAPFQGAVLFDRSGLSLAGALAGGSARAEALGAMLSEAVAEAVRTTEHLDLGVWRGLLVETGEHALHIAPLDDDHLVLFAAAPGAPAGWVLRTATRAAKLARAFLERDV